MTESLPPEVDRFLELVDAFGDAIGSAQFTVIAYWTGDKWMSLATRVQFGGSAGPETVLDIPDLLEVVSARMSADDAASLLTEASSSGTFTLRNLTVHLPRLISPRLDRKGERLYFYSTPYDPGHNSAVLLSAGGVSTEQIVSKNPTDWQKLEEALENLNPPYLGLEDLAESHVGYPIGRAYNAMLYALLLIPLRILEAEVARQGKLQLKLRRDSHISRDEVAFGIVVKPEAGTPFRHAVPLTNTTIIQESRGIETIQLDVPIADNAEVVVQLRARNEVLGTTRLYPGISSPRLRCHGILDPGETYLEKALTDYRGRRFAQAVAMILHLAGFKVESSHVLEEIVNDNYADVLAFTPNEQTVVVGACVFKDVKPQDVTLLASSYRSTKTTLETQSVTVVPILFTSVPFDTLPQFLREQAQGEEIRVGSREDLVSALDLIRSGAGPAEVLPVFGRWIYGQQ